MDNPYAQGATMDLLHNRGRSIDAQVDAATSSPPATPAPRPTMQAATGVPGESSHNPENRTPGPTWGNAVRGFVKAYTE